MSLVVVTIACPHCGSERIRARGGTRRLNKKQSVRYCHCLQCGRKEKITILSGAYYRVVKYEERAAD